MGQASRADAAPFPFAVSTASGWREAAERIAERLSGTKGGLGLFYVGEAFAPHLVDMSAVLRARTAVTDWIGAVGFGVIATGDERYADGGVVAMVLDLAPDAYRLFAGGAEAGRHLAETEAAWIDRAVMPIAITHADPRRDATMAAVQSFASATGCYLVGGLTSATTAPPHLSGDMAGGEISGAMISPAAIEVATSLTQGCTPIGPVRRVTRAEAHVIMELDGRPALDVFKEDIGEILARDLRRVAGYIFAARPVEGSDTADYTVRNLMALDPGSGAIAVADSFEAGDAILFCRRDPTSAVEDMERMVGDLARRVGDRPIRGGLYVSCTARGPNQFSPEDREIDHILRGLGEFPLVGFFANGELNRDRIYAYTGVLTLFL
jgi:small ligand-binding sensory domain FIST